MEVVRGDFCIQTSNFRFSVSLERNLIMLTLTHSTFGDIDIPMASDRQAIVLAV